MNNLKIGVTEISGVLIIVFAGVLIIVFGGMLLLKGSFMFAGYLFPSSQNGTTTLYEGQGELTHKLFIDCMNLANNHQDKATSLSTVESEAGDLVDACRYYAQTTSADIVESGGSKNSLTGDL